MKSMSYEGHLELVNMYFVPANDENVSVEAQRHTALFFSSYEIHYLQIDLNQSFIAY